MGTITRKQTSVVVGGSLAGAKAAEELREYGLTGVWSWLRDGRSSRV